MCWLQGSKFETRVYKLNMFGVDTFPNVNVLSFYQLNLLIMVSIFVFHSDWLRKFFENK